jgi:hypothetical protein
VRKRAATTARAASHVATQGGRNTPPVKVFGLARNESRVLDFSLYGKCRVRVDAPEGTVIEVKVLQYSSSNEFRAYSSELPDAATALWPVDPGGTGGLRTLGKTFVATTSSVSLVLMKPYIIPGSAVVEVTAVEA